MEKEGQTGNLVEYLLISFDVIAIISDVIRHLMKISKEEFLSFPIGNMSPFYPKCFSFFFSKS